MRKTVEISEMRSLKVVPQEVGPAPGDAPAMALPTGEEAEAAFDCEGGACLILADDENGQRANPVQDPKRRSNGTATDRAARSPRTSTVTDGEAG